MSQTTRDLLDDHAPTAELTETERHCLLAVDRRRHVLDVVAGREEPIGLDALAAAVLECEHGVDPSDADDVATTLHHVHLPKMVDAGVLAYDAAAKRITP